jgi:hypothetical protein
MCTLSLWLIGTLAARCTASVMVVMSCGQGAPIIQLRDAHIKPVVLVFRANLPFVWKSEFAFVGRRSHVHLWCRGF